MWHRNKRRGMLLPPTTDYCNSQPWISQSWADCQKLLEASITILVLLHIHFETWLWSTKNSCGLVRNWFLTGEITFLCPVIDFNQPVFCWGQDREGPCPHIHCLPQISDTLVRSITHKWEKRVKVDSDWILSESPNHDHIRGTSVISSYTCQLTYGKSLMENMSQDWGDGTSE